MAWVASHNRPARAALAARWERRHPQVTASAVTASMPWAASLSSIDEYW
jgi:hypothetical protein